jgi:hypothetical protein
VPARWIGQGTALVRACACGVLLEGIGSSERDQTPSAEGMLSLPMTHKLDENSDDDFEASTELNQPAGGLPVLIAN